MALYQRACDLGSPVACNDLGILFESEPNRAVPLLERACALGLPRGCSNLAYFVAREPNGLDRATELVDGACAKSDAWACVQLGDYTYGGPKVTHQHGRAFTAYERGCELHDWTGCARAAWMLREGRGVARNVGRATERFRMACQNEEYGGCYGLGATLIEDAQNESDWRRALEWLDLACSHDHADACALQALEIAKAHGGLTPESERLFARACRLGSEHACRVGAPEP